MKKDIIKLYYDGRMYYSSKIGNYYKQLSTIEGSEIKGLYHIFCIDKQGDPAEIQCGKYILRILNLKNGEYIAFYNFKKNKWQEIDYSFSYADTAEDEFLSNIFHCLDILEKEIDKKITGIK